METTVSHQTEKYQKPKALLIVLTTLLAVMGILSFILHISPDQLVLTVTDFAAHNYFLFGFICLTLAFATFRYYIALNEKLVIDDQKRSLPGYSRRKRRKAIINNIRHAFDHSATNAESQYLAKEKLENLKFDQEDVLAESTHKFERTRDLQNALQLGNLYKQNVIICFKDANGLKHTLGTVWHVDDSNICLKSGKTLPVKSIIKIEI